MKTYIDVNFTVEEDWSEFTDEEKEKLFQKKQKIIDLFKKDLLSNLSYYADNIKDLNVALTYEK